MHTNFDVSSYFVVVRAIRGFLNARVFTLITNLHAHHRVHIEPGKLPRLDYRDAHLVILGFQRAVPGIARLRNERSFALILAPK